MTNNHASIQYYNTAMEQSACLGDGAVHLFDWKVMLTVNQEVNNDL